MLFFLPPSKQQILAISNCYMSFLSIKSAEILLSEGVIFQIDLLVEVLVSFCVLANLLLQFKDPLHLFQIASWLFSLASRQKHLVACWAYLQVPCPHLQNKNAQGNCTNVVVFFFFVPITSLILLNKYIFIEINFAFMVASFFFISIFFH